MIPELNRIYHGDCLEIMRGWPDEVFDLTLTSPPYGDMRDYKGYQFLAAETLAQIFRLTKRGGVCVWVVGDQTKNGSESLESFRHAMTAVEVGFNLHDTMIYRKNGFRFPETTRRRYEQVFEYMFVFSHGTPKAWNPLKRKTVWGGLHKQCTERQPDGTLTEFETTLNEEANRDNIWTYEVGWRKSAKDEIAHEHPAIFPEQLAQDHIASWSNEGDIVFDPFMGSGTTALAATRLGRNFVGCEISPAYIEIASKRIAPERAQGKLL